jgi:O-antigen/teichoic acid export membrane protein
MVFAASIYAARRMDVDQGLGIVERLLSVGLTVALLRAGWGLKGLAVSTNALSVLFYLFRAFLCFRIVPGLRLSLSLVSRASVKEICGFGFFNFVVNAAERVFVYAGTLVIGIFLTAAAITYYSIAANLIPYFMALITAVLWTLTPYATACDARGDREALRALLLRGTRGTLLLASIVGGGLIFLGRDFIRVWMGDRFVSGEEYPSSAVILTLLAVSGLVRSFEGCGRQILLGMRRVRLLAMLAIIEVALNFLVSSLLVGRLGILGVALGTLLPLLLTQGFLTSYFVVRLLGVDWRELARSAIRGCVPALAAMAGAWLLLDPLLHPAGWPGLVLKAALIAFPAPLVGWSFTLKREEREMVLRRILPARRGSEV